MREYILSAALMLPNSVWKGQDLIISVPRPARHHHLLRGMYEPSRGRSNGWDQGFLTSRGRYVDREKGLKIAIKAGQIIEKQGNSAQLFSEDMW